MKKPDIELKIDRDTSGFITDVSYKVYNAGEENRRILEFCELIQMMFTNYQELLQPTINVVVKKEKK